MLDGNRVRQNGNLRRLAVPQLDARILGAEIRRVITPTASTSGGDHDMPGKSVGFWRQSTRSDRTNLGVVGCTCLRASGSDLVTPQPVVVLVRVDTTNEAQVMHLLSGEWHQLAQMDARH